MGRQNLIKNIVLCLGALTSSGCATIISGGGETQSVRFTSSPRGAKVYVDDNYIGVTPTASALTRRDDHFVRMELAGQVKTQDLHSGLNPWIFGNILLGGVIGIVVDAASGAFTWPGAGEVSKDFAIAESDVRTSQSEKTLLPSRPPSPLLGSDGKPFRTNND